MDHSCIKPWKARWKNLNHGNHKCTYSTPWPQRIAQKKSPYLKSLLLRDIPTPVTYRSLAVAIAYLENIETENLSFVYESLESNNFSQVAGACAAIYMKKIVLKDDDFNKIMSYVTQPKYLEHIGKVTNPFLFILAASYLYPEQNRQKIVDFSRQFDISIVKDIINDVTKGKDGRRVSLF